jgi:hypothetical protein
MPSNQTYNLTSTGSSTDPNYTCPDNPNVVPDYDWYHDGSEQFTVCPKNTSIYDILVHGKTHSSDTICVYPTQVIDSQHVYVKPDVTTGLPLSVCIKIADTGVYANFDQINFNAAFIVEQPDDAAMRTCLYQGNYTNCPRYSFGKFR